MAYTVEAFEGGFADPVFEAQACFKALMNALANPGKLQALAVETAPPEPLTAELAAIAAALFDHDTKIWLDRTLAASNVVREWLRFQTGAVLTDEVAEADFALVSNVTNMPPLEAFAKGSAEYPDRSATIIIAVAGFDGAEVLQLQGPGIEHQRDFAPAMLPVRFREQWAANSALFPRGVDLVFTAPHGVCAMPRSSRITNSAPKKREA